MLTASKHRLRDLCRNDGADLAQVFADGFNLLHRAKQEFEIPFEVAGFVFYRVLGVVPDRTNR